jgi:hypothetical protein
MKLSTTFRRTHVSLAAIEALDDRGPHAKKNRSPYKPSGVWYEVDAGWRAWCHSEQPGWLSNRLLYRVDLRDARILTIRTESQLSRFHKEYVKPLAPGEPALGFYIGPDYERIAAEGYDGIEIAPYQWRYRLRDGFMWYYGWDCASGCVWNASKIAVAQIARLPDLCETGKEL